MNEPAHAGNPSPRAFLRLGGASLARHQLTLALSAGCQKIICLAASPDAELIELQHEAEQAGVRFHVISGARALCGHVTIADEVLVISEGLLPLPGEALRLLHGSPAVLVLPAETAVPAGYERIDAELASAGLMLLPGRLVERLNDLPADADPASALMRIALQAGITRRPVAPALMGNGQWLMIRNEDEAHAAENNWMARHTSGPVRTPGLGLAALVVRRFGPALLHAGSGGSALVLAASALLIIAFVAGWFGWITVAFALCCPAWVIRRSAAILERIHSDALGLKPSLMAREDVFDWVMDALLFALLVMASTKVGDAGLMARGFVPVMLIGLLRLLPRVFSGRGVFVLTDRFVLSVLLVLLSLAQVMAITVPWLAIALLAAGLFLPRDEDVLTRV